MKEFFKGVWTGMVLNYIYGREISAKLMPKTTILSWIIRQTFMIIWNAVNLIMIPIGLIVMAIRVVSRGKTHAAQEAKESIIAIFSDLPNQAQEEAVEVLKDYLDKE